ncbi:MAG: hypothetical protein M3016_07825, partial [Actinomycetota bacterium]|nr:hypothetical protein [Actinomycetota bacterium]
MDAPLWRRYALSVLVAGCLLAGMVIFVNGHNTDSNPSTNPATAVRANREAEILVAQDQAPRSARLETGSPAVGALERAIHARLAAQVAGGAIPGPLA